MSLSEYCFLGFLLSALAAAVLVWVGWRGKRVGTHLHCRQCEYDLDGLERTRGAVRSAAR